MSPQTDASAADDPLPPPETAKHNNALDRSIHQSINQSARIRTDSKKLFSRTFQDLQRPNSRVFQDSQNSFSRTFGINSVHKHGCIRSKKCTYQISYRCNCITVTVFLKFILTQKATNCTQGFTMNFFSS